MIMKSIKSRLIILIGLLLVIVSIGQGVISYITASSALVSNISKTLPQIATQAADTVQATLDSNLDAMEVIASINDIKNSNSLENKLLILQNEVKRNGSIKMGYADLAGNIVYTDGSTDNIRDSESFKKAFSGENNVADPVVSKDGQSLTMAYAVPIKNNNSITAVLVSIRDGMELSEILKKIDFGKTGRGFMVNSKASSIAYKDKSMPLSQYNGIAQAEKDPSLKAFADMEKKMIAGETGLSKYTFGGTPGYSGYAPVKKEKWSISVLIEESELLSELNSLKVSAAISSLIFLIVSFGVVFIIAHKLADSIKYSSNFLKILSTGDFSNKIEEKYLSYKDEIGTMSNSMKSMQCSINQMLTTFISSSNKTNDESTSLSTISDKMTSSSNNVTNAIQEVANGTSTQAGNLIEISDILNSFSNELESIVKDIVEVDKNTLIMNDLANDSNNNMTLLMESVSSISISFKSLVEKIFEYNSSIKEVNNIVNIINSIADQTNLLALNASIEAASAGEAGRGFAVIAQEIRGLAEQTKESSNNVTELISNISQNTNIVTKNTEGMKIELDDQISIINQTINSFERIIKVIQVVIPKIQSVNSSTTDIKNEKDIIVNKIEMVSSIAQEISASTEEITSSSEEMNNLSKEVSSSSLMLSEMTREMLEQLQKFKV
ncbi:MAG: methyl-accepting chemotaxis protein [Clostridiaceae bacterium]